MSSGQPIRDGRLVTYMDTVILSIIGLFALLTVPRLISRYSRREEWPRGLFLRKHSKSINTAASESSDDKRSIRSKYSLSSLRGEAFEAGDYVPRSPPRRVSSWSGLFPSVTAKLRYPISLGFSVGQAIVMGGYFAIVLATRLWYWQNPFSNPNRTGFIAVSQVPIVFALATKNNIIGTFLALGYEKLNFLHRFVGIIAVLAANFHGLTFFYVWTYTGELNQFDVATIYTGLLALIGMDLLAVFSTAFWRQKHYNVFIYTHIAGFILVVVGVCFHMPTAIPFASAAAGIYALDHIVRLLKTKVSIATLHPIKALGSTRIEVPCINTGWRAGQHVRIRVLSLRMGFFGWLEAHPFTIAGVSEGGMILVCKNVGGWTTRLFNLANCGVSDEKGQQIGDVRVTVEGPYGGVGHTMMNRFSGAMFVVGGSGITFALASIQELLQQHLEGETRVGVIHLVWSVKDPAALTPMLPQFSSFIQGSGTMDVRISVHYTNATLTDVEIIQESLPTGITLSVGRPIISDIIESVIDRTCTRVGVFGVRSGIIVGVCGPVTLGEQVRKVVGAVESTRRLAVGGIELCEEVFSF